MNRSLKIALTVITLLWLLGSLLPLFTSMYGSLINLFPFLQIFYSPVCHQNAEKLICSEYGCTFLCARCIGIYSGVFIASLIATLKKSIVHYDIKYLVLLSLPLLIDVILATIGVYNYLKVIAYLTGLIFGCAAFYYFYIGLENLFSEKKRLG